MLGQRCERLTNGLLVEANLESESGACYDDEQSLHYAARGNFRKWGASGVNRRGGLSIVLGGLKIYKGTLNYSIARLGTETKLNSQWNQRIGPPRRACELGNLKQSIVNAKK